MVDILDVEDGDDAEEFLLALQHWIKTQQKKSATSPKPVSFSFHLYPDPVPQPLFKDGHLLQRPEPGTGNEVHVKGDDVDSSGTGDLIVYYLCMALLAVMFLWLPAMIISFGLIEWRRNV